MPIMDKGENHYYVRYETGNLLKENWYEVDSREIAVIKFVKELCKEKELSIMGIDPESFLVVGFNKHNQPIVEKPVGPEFWCSD